MGERRAPVEGKFFPNLNPATGENIGEIPDSGLMDVVAAVQAANKAAPEWAKKSIEDRAVILEKIAARIEASGFELAELCERETGAPLSVTQETSIADSIAVFRLHAKRLQTKSEMNRGGDGLVLRNRLPGSVSSIILPWSDPVFSLCRKLAPAIAAGGPIICKPSHLSPSAALRIAELSIEAGLPPGVFNVVCGKREDLGVALLEHPGISLVSFTGSTEAGQKVYAKAAEAFKKVQLSLGGRNAVCVFSDVDIESTAQVVADIMFNFHRLMPERGSRLFVQETIYKQFLEALKVASLKLTTGPLPDESARIRFLAACAQAGSEKGKPLFEANEQSKNGFYVPSQAFVDLTLCSTLQQEEVPGPFASIASFKYQHDAVKHANNCPMGYSAYLFMEDQEKVVKVAQKIEASRVYINMRAKRAVDAETYPVKQSGFGGEGPEALLDFFSRPNLIVV